MINNRNTNKNMLDSQTVNLTFGEFVQNVATSNPEIGRSFMGDISFVSGLPNGLTNGVMTVISYGKGFIKFILDVESTPKHYECYRLSDGTITDWTTGQGGGGEGNVIVTADITNIDEDNNRFYIEHLSEEPAAIWDLVVNQNKSVVIELSWENRDGHKIMQLLNVTSTMVVDNIKMLEFENNNIVLFQAFGIMALQFGSFDGLWETYGYIQVDEDNVTNITWTELKSLRDDSQLVPGMQYRITDYECSTSQEYTQSANNMFDIIVTADDERTLNENARACKRDWENFFIHAVTFERIDNAIIVKSKFNSDVTLPLNPDGYHSAEEGYDLYGAGSFFILVPNDMSDNDITCQDVFMADMEHPEEDYSIKSTGVTLLSFILTDSEETKYFDDSNLNAWELKYCLDNDNSRFEWADTNNGKGVIYYMKDEWNNECGYDFKNIQFFKKIVDEQYWYTFTDIEYGTGKITDGSLNLNGNVYQNAIGTYIQNKQYLKSNIFCAIKLNASNNVLGANCSGNVFYGSKIEGNVFGTGCQSNIFKGETCCNTFGADCKLNEFDNLYYSTFGNNCTYIDSAYSKHKINNCIFGDNCNGIVPVNCDFENMTFGNGCSGLPISSDSGILPNVSSGWIFDIGVGVGDTQQTITGITLNDKNNEQLTYTLHKRVTQTRNVDGTLMIYSIKEYIDSNTNKDYVKLLYPSGRGGVIEYNSDEEITGDWIDNNTDTTANTYDPDTGDGTLQLNEDVTEIGGEVTREGLRASTINSPFYMNANVRSVDMSQSGLVNIGIHAFDSCVQLSNVIMPNTVTEIGAEAFAGCPLNSVDIPDIVTKIDTDAFKDGTININYNGSSSGSPWGAQYVNAPTDKDSGLMFGKFETKNYSCAVIGCIVKGKDVKVTIPDKYNDGKNEYSVIAIGDYAFRNCTNILSITIPDSVTGIGSYIFDGCYTMKEKDKVSTILSVTELSSSVPSTGSLTFDSNCLIDYLYVPTDDAVALYNNAQWNKYFKTISTQKKSGSEER